MDDLNWDLTVISKSIAFPNLLAASENVGLSQPQLSRIVRRLEECYGVQLLDRSAKRSSSWTTQALQLVEIYRRTSRQFRVDVARLNEDFHPTLIRICALDGLASVASNVAAYLFETLGIEVIQVDLADLSHLEAQYAKGSIDFALTSREPGRKKRERVHLVGYQTLSSVGIKSKIRVLSSFEFYAHPPSEKVRKKILVSNALAVREHWIKERGGYGTLPSPIRFSLKKIEGEQPVYLLGSDALPESVWKAAVRGTRR